MYCRKVYYTRSNPDPKLVVIVDNPDRIGKKKQREDLDAKVSLLRVNSLPQKVVSLQDIEFDLEFEHSLFRNKSESDLNNIVIDPGFISSLEIKKEIQALIDFLNFLTKGPHLFSISDNTK